MPRATASATISFGLVSIPLKLYTACSSEQARFNLLNPNTHSKVKQQYIDPTTGEVIERNEMVKGYEIARGQFVMFSPEELKALENDRTNTIDVHEFVPSDSVDLIGVEKTYYLGPDKGGDKAYRLFAQALANKEVMAVARWATRGKNELVVIRPYEGGLILHQMFYAKEIRSFSEVMEGVAKIEANKKEKDLAEALIDQLSCEEFDPSKYHDEYAVRVLEAAQAKAAGGEIPVVEVKDDKQVLDLFDALKSSLDQQKPAKKKASKKKPTKKATAKKRKVG